MTEHSLRLEIRYDSRMIRLALSAAMLFAVAAEVASESVTLTTYYPAPSGVYAQMITTDRTDLAKTGGTVTVGAADATPKVKINITQNNALQVGTAYVSSGGNMMNLSTNEYYNGTSWVQSNSGLLLQMSGSDVSFWTHDAAGNHTLAVRLSASCRLVTMNNGSASTLVSSCNPGECATLTNGICSATNFVVDSGVSNNMYCCQ